MDKWKLLDMWVKCCNFPFLTLVCDFNIFMWFTYSGYHDRSILACLFNFFISLFIVDLNDTLLYIVDALNCQLH